MDEVSDTHALRRCFGLDKLLVRDHHITTEALHKAAQWPMIEQVLLVNTLRWLGHVAQMPAHRLPKQALWGFWADGSFRPRHATTHIQWIHRTLQYADIHEMHWFRLAQNTEDTTWDTLLRRAFPRHILNNRGKRAISAWKPGRPLPDTTVRRRRTRNVWARPASMLSNKECPACGKVCANAHERKTHYNQTHAVTGLHLTTIPTFQCKECLRHFHNAWTLASHSCPAIHQLPIPEGADETGWKPLRVPQLNPPPREWTLYTDGSGGTAAHPQAGWGLAVYDAAECQQIYRRLRTTRNITWQWVKGHANHTGNEKANRLADAGSRGQVGEHSKRWAAPHRLALAAVNTEKCRKCGRFFRDARICGAHEMTCTAGPAILTDEQPCRKCGEMQKDRKARTAHEAILGSQTPVLWRATLSVNPNSALNTALRTTHRSGDWHVCKRKYSVAALEIACL